MEAAQMPKGDLIHKCYVKTDFCKRFDSSGINAVLYGIVPTYEYNAFNPVKNKFFFSPLYSRDQKNQQFEVCHLARQQLGLFPRNAYGNQTSFSIYTDAKFNILRNPVQKNLDYESFNFISCKLKKR